MKGDENMMQKLTYLGLVAKSKLDSFLQEERGDVNIVSIVVLIGIAVVLAIVFKDAIGNLITSLLNQIIPNANNAIQPIN